MSSFWRLLVEEFRTLDASCPFALELVKDKLLDDEAAVLFVGLFERRRLKSAWKEAMEDSRRSELRRESGWTSLDPLLRESMLFGRSE